MDAQKPLNQPGSLDLQDIFQASVAILQSYSNLFTYVDSNRLDVAVTREHLKPAIKALIDARWGYLAAITGLDHPATDSAEGKIEVLYHFCKKAAVVTLRTTVPYSDAVLPSVCDLIPVATLYEREMIEMFGVQIEGTPDTSRLLLPDDWPDGVYPLRKAFKGLK